MLKKQQLQIIQEEENNLKNEIIRLNENSQKVFSGHIIQAFSDQLELGANAVVDDSETYETNPSLQVRGQKLPAALDGVVQDAVAMISEYADRYIIEKKRRAVIELESAFAELVNEVDESGENLWATRMREAQKYVCNPIFIYCAL